MQTTLVTFSPCGKTREVGAQVSRLVSGDFKQMDLLHQPPHTSRQFGTDERLIVAMPVFAGRIPAVCPTMLANLQGAGTPAIAIVVYGNRAYEDALLELCDILTAQGFVVVGAAAFVAQHSIFTNVAAQRPDTQDQEVVQAFAAECKAKISTHTYAMTMIVKGNQPYCNGTAVSLAPTGNHSCTACGACSRLCPVGAIAPETPRKTDSGRCISCMACVSVCQVHARTLHGLKYWLAKQVFAKKMAVRQEPEYFL